MRFFTLLFTLLLLKAGNAFAQNGYFEAGFIIQQNDTTYGFIERDIEARLGQSIKFKTHQDTKDFVEYTPQDISGFGFSQDNLWFEAVSAEIKNKADFTKTERFAKVLLKGYTSLYKLQLLHTEHDPILLSGSSYVYILKKEDKYYTLAQHEYMVENAAGVNKRYIGTLTYTLQDCSEVLRNISQLAFKDQPIIELVQDYNACASPESQTSNYVYEVKPVIRHGVDVSSTLVTSDNSNGRNYSVGYFIDTYKPDLSKRISAKLGVNYYFSKSGTSIYRLETNRARHVVGIPLALQLNLGSAPQAAFIPFISAGTTSIIYTASSSVRMFTALTFGAGAYIHRVKTACYTGLGGPTAIDFSIGVRLDKRNR